MRILLLLSFTVCVFCVEQSIQNIGEKITQLENSGKRFVDSTEVFFDEAFGMASYRTIKDLLPATDQDIPENELKGAFQEATNTRIVTYAGLLKAVGKRGGVELTDKLGTLSYIGGCYAPVTKLTNANGDGQGKAILTFKCTLKQGVDVIIVIAPECIKLGNEYRLGEFTRLDTILVR